VAEDLLQLLRSGNPADRWKAATHLVDAARSQQAEVLEALADALADSHPFVRWCAGMTLVQADRPQAIAMLVDALDKGPPHGRAAAADALAYVRKAKAEPLLQALTSEEVLVRQSAAEALGRLRYRSAISRLVTLLTDDSPWVRRAATRALAHIADANTVDPLTLRLGDDSPWVRRSAAYALGAMRSRQATSALIAALEDPDHQVRRNAIWALSRIKDSAALPTLRALQANTALDSEVAQEIKTAINAIQRPVWRWLSGILKKWSVRRAPSIP
jgi:HEAT repeat protein